MRRHSDSLIERSLGSPESFPIVHSRAAFMELARRRGDPGSDNRDYRNAAKISRTGSSVSVFPTVLKADGTFGRRGCPDGAHGRRGAASVSEIAGTAAVWRERCKRALLDRDRTLLRPSLLRRRPTVNRVSPLWRGMRRPARSFAGRATVLASLHFEVLRKCSAAGHATVVRLIENTEMSTAVERVVRRMGLSGFYGFDFMLEAGTGHAYLIEINPRATQVGHITLGAGRDLPAALYGAVSGHPIRVCARGDRE